jgi:hypothetical protein
MTSPPHPTGKDARYCILLNPKRKRHYTRVHFFFSLESGKLG